VLLLDILHHMRLAGEVWHRPFALRCKAPDWVRLGLNAKFRSEVVSRSFSKTGLRHCVAYANRILLKGSGGKASATVHHDERAEPDPLC
jgi:hypothetical protein